jgi:hypothetical protein
MKKFGDFITEVMLGDDGNDPQYGVGSASRNDSILLMQQMVKKIKSLLYGPIGLGVIPLSNVDPNAAKILGDALKSFESALQDATE